MHRIVTFLIILEDMKESLHTVQSLPAARQKVMVGDYYSSFLSALCEGLGSQGEADKRGAVLFPLV